MQTHLHAATERALARVRSGSKIAPSARAEGIAPSTLFRALARIRAAGQERVQRVVIVGAGALARELVQWLRKDMQASVWFLCDGEPACDTMRLLATPSGYERAEDDILLAAIADPAQRERVCGGMRLDSWASSSAIVGDAEIGAGSLLMPRALVSAQAVLGRGCIVNVGSSIGHDVILGDWCTVSSQCDITGQLRSEADTWPR